MSFMNVWPEINLELCDGCGRCVTACPHGALEVVGGKVTLARPDDCSWDGECELACPQGAIQVPYAVVLPD